jgi:CubicO group peptidase (beta-lactamase class C family)
MSAAQRRTRHPRRLLLSILLVMLAVPAAGSAAEIERVKPESVGMSSERLARIGQVMKRHIDAGDITGAVTAIARRGKLVHFEAHGVMDVEAKQPMPTDAIFRMASSTKPVTGVAVLMMMEEGKLALTDPVYRFIPEFRGAKVEVRKAGAGPDAAAGAAAELVPATREITVKDLLTHTSGLNSDRVGTPGPGDTLASFIPKLGAVPLDFQPGSRWRYAGGPAFSTLSRIVEVVSGQPFDQFTRERIFDPLGMKDTFFILPEDRRSRLLPLYRRGASGWERVAGADRAGPETTFIAGSGGLVSTAHDYLRFEQMLVGGGALDGARLLSPTTVALMSANHVGDLYGGFAGTQQGVGFGLTVYVVLDSARANSRRSNGAFGWGGAFGTTTWSDPAQKLVAVLMIQQRDLRVQADFENAVLQAIVE